MTDRVLPKGACKKLREFIVDEKKGIAEYEAFQDMLRSEGITAGVYSAISAIKIQEKSHRRKLESMHSLYCKRRS